MLINRGNLVATKNTSFLNKVETPSVTYKRIEEIMRNSDIITHRVFDKCTIVSCRLPNGFIIVESSTCVDPENYNEEIGINICLDKIEDRIWKLEAYRLQEELHRENIEKNNCDYDCGNCYCDECHYTNR